MTAITSAGTGFWDIPATWTGGVVPVLGDKVTIQSGHVVTLRDTRSCGDDTTSQTATSNAVVIVGTLSFSRIASSQLTVRGNMCVATNGAFDCGSIASPIPAGITATIIINDSATLAAGKHGFCQKSQSNCTISVVGKQRACNTTIATAFNAGATSIDVANATGWEVGDELVIGPYTHDTAQCQLVTISSVSGNTIGVSAITTGRAIGCRVANLSSNITIRSINATYPGVAYFSTSGTGSVTIQDVLFKDMGGGAWSSYTAGGASGAISLDGTGPGKATVKRCKVRSTSAISTGVATQFSGTVNTVDDCALYLPTITNTLAVSSGGAIDMRNCVAYKSYIGIEAAQQYGTFTNCEFYCTDRPLKLDLAIDLLATSCKFKTSGNVLIYINTIGRVVLRNCDMYSVQSTISAQAGAGVGTIVAESCNWNGVIPTFSTNSAPILLAKFYNINPDGVALDSRLSTIHGPAITDSSTRNRGIRSVKVTGAYTTVPAVADLSNMAVTSGVPVRILGYMRADTTYGTTTPPTLTVFGCGMNYTYTMPANTNTWNLIDTTLTPTSSGTVNITISGTPASANGNYWLDGVVCTPFTSSVWHYGFLQGDSLLNIVDPYITSSETSISTSTGITTLDSLYDALTYWAITHPLTDGYAVIATAIADTLDLGAYNLVVDGAASSSYDVVGSTITIKASMLSVGTKFRKATTTGSITFQNGAFPDSAIIYTSSSGTSAPVTAPGAIDGSVVQLYNATTSTEIANETVSGGVGFVGRMTWTTDQTLRLRVTYCDGATAKAATETFGVLTESGASFVIAQTADPIYAANGINGATVTEFAADYPNVHIDVSDADKATTVQRLYAWWVYNLASTVGIAAYFGGIVADDIANYMVKTALVNVKLDNLLATPVMFGGGRLYSDDGTSVIADTSGSIQMDPSKAYLAQASELAELHAIHGLKAGAPMTVTPTSRVAGSITQSISGDGVATSTVERV